MPVSRLIEYLREHGTFWDYRALSGNPALTLEALREMPVDAWDYPTLASNPAILYAYYRAGQSASEPSEGGIDWQATRLGIHFWKTDLWRLVRHPEMRWDDIRRIWDAETAASERFLTAIMYNPAVSPAMIRAEPRRNWALEAIYHNPNMTWADRDLVPETAAPPGTMAREAFSIRVEPATIRANPGAWPWSWPAVCQNPGVGLADILDPAGTGWPREFAELPLDVRIANYCGNPAMTVADLEAIEASGAPAAGGLDWFDIARNPGIPWAWILHRFRSAPETFKGAWCNISARADIDFDTVRRHPHFPWCRKCLSRNPAMFLDDREDRVARMREKRAARVICGAAVNAWLNPAFAMCRRRLYREWAREIAADRDM